MTDQRPRDLSSPIRAFLSPAPPALREAQTVADAVRELRASDVPPGGVVYFYAVDEAGRLSGVLSTRQLLLEAPDKMVGEIMSREVVRVGADGTLRDAARLMLGRRLLAAPVVDDDGRLVGAIDVAAFADGLSTSLEEFDRDDFFQLVGVRLAREGETAFRSWRRRFPWLLCNIAGGLVCAAIVAAHRPLTEAAPLLAAFVPLALALAESLGMQSTTLALQSLHGARRPGLRFLVAGLKREAATAALLALACGALVAGASWIWRGERALVLAVGLGVGSGMLVAGLFGVAVPVLVRALKVDPRVASGPVVLAASDLCALGGYFFCASVWLS